MKSIPILIILCFTFFSNTAIENISTENIISIEDHHSKKEAFEILKTKCNICHEKKNKKRVFTMDNMDGFGNKIYKQVFKWKRMPKGNDIKLTSTEYQQLKNWLSSININ